MARSPGRHPFASTVFWAMAGQGSALGCDLYCTGYARWSASAELHRDRIGRRAGGCLDGRSSGCLPGSTDRTKNHHHDPALQETAARAAPVWCRNLKRIARWADVHPLVLVVNVHPPVLIDALWSCTAGNGGKLSLPKSYAQDDKNDEK